jgi:enterochelin esterase-like enzyme
VGTDIPRNMQGLPMSRGDNGVWEATVGPLDPGAYRYHFNVNGVAVIDPRSPTISESNNNVWSLVYVPGADVMDTKDVPHGAVATVTYHSSALQRVRRMHLYTPPGYELGTGRFPAFYLLHGAGDNDDSWTSVGRAGFILDNLIAAKKAVPMIVVMPAGHTSRTPVSAIGRAATDEFVQDFVQDVMPYVETHYRVIADRSHRAIAGLSMGGNQTLHVAFPRLDQFAYVGVFSSGLLGIAPGGRGAAPVTGTPPTAPALDEAWVKENVAAIDAGAKKHALTLFWFATGSEDRLLPATKATVEMFKAHGFTPVFKESAGGHTWLNWRDYLTEFAPRLFH